MRHLLRYYEYRSTICVSFMSSTALISFLLALFDSYSGSSSFFLALFCGITITVAPRGEVTSFLSFCVCDLVLLEVFIKGFE